MPDQKKSATLLPPFSEILLDLRVRSGIKLSLASLLSLYVALVLRLEHPDWAVLTTLVMMNSHFVGSTSLKWNRSRSDLNNRLRRLRTLLQAGARGGGRRKGGPAGAGAKLRLQRFFVSA